MCPQEHETITLTRCVHCGIQTMGDPDAQYNKRLNGRMCGICVDNAKIKLMAYLRRNQRK